jgi:uncharacterized protein (DUF433 family)
MPLDLYDGHDPRDLPAYTVREAAHYLRIPVSTLRSWVLGRDYPVQGGTERFEPVIALPSQDRSELSFTNLVEAHVLAAVRREHRVPLDRVRAALDYVRTRLGVQRPLADVTFETDGSHLFLEQMGDLVNVSRGGQVAARAWLQASLKRIDRGRGRLAARLWLFTRSGPALDQPRVVVVDPRLQFGRPVLAGTGVPTAMLRDRYLAGESVGELAADYGCDPLMVEEAIRCELLDAA